jgi:hypothetical protein
MTLESPETLFLDVIEAQVVSQMAQYSIDPLFIEACEQGSLKVIAAHCDQMGLRSSKVYLQNGSLHICLDADTEFQRSRATLTVRVTVVGVRKAHTARWPEYTEAQANKNFAFWRQATDT